MNSKHLDGRFPDRERPHEYKDAPLEFTFVLDGHEEPVKIVEPDIDLPFPDGGRLLVDEAGDRLCDVTYRFEPESDKPYRLIFKVSDGVRHTAPHCLIFGASGAARKDLSAVHRHSLVERGNLSALIEMARGKARLYIRYFHQGRRREFA